jgi:hypothetical protein
MIGKKLSPIDLLEPTPTVDAPVGYDWEKQIGLYKDPKTQEITGTVLASETGTRTATPQTAWTEDDDT